MNTLAHAAPSLWRIQALEAWFEFLRVLRTPAFAIPSLAFPVVFYVLFAILLPGQWGDYQKSAYLLATYGAFGVIGPALFGVMWDPMAFRIAEEAGEGARIRMRLGGKSGEVSGDPIDLDVTVKKIARGVRQPYGPVMVPLGDMALLSSEHVDVAICTLRTQTFHADAFKAVGADPADYRVVVVKSAQHFYNGFVGVAKEILYVATPGAADPDVTRWPYTKRKTPFWPKVADPWK